MIRIAVMVLKVQYWPLQIVTLYRFSLLKVIIILYISNRMLGVKKKQNQAIDAISKFGIVPSLFDNSNNV